MTLPATVSLGAHTFTPRLPSLPVLITFSRVLQGTEAGSVAWTEAVLSALDACHPPTPPRPWGKVSGDLATIGRAVGAGCEAQGVAPMDAYAAADELAGGHPAGHGAPDAGGRGGGDGKLRGPGGDWLRRGFELAREWCGDGFRWLTLDEEERAMLIALSTPPKADTDEEEREPTPEERARLREIAIERLMEISKP